MVRKSSDFVKVPKLTGLGHKSMKRKHVTANDKRKNELLALLEQVGCIHVIYEETVNIFHESEVSPGGYYIWYKKPELVLHV